MKFWFLSWMDRASPLFHLLVLYFCYSVKAAEVAHSTIVVTRSLAPAGLTETVDRELLVPKRGCSLSPKRKIVFSHPASLDRKDRFFVLGSLSYEAIALIVDHTNKQRCGVDVNGTRYAIELRTFGDNSNPEKHAAIGEYIVNSTDFFLAGYSSSLTQHLVPIAQDAKKVIVTGGSNRVSIYKDRDYAFGILPSQESIFFPVIEGVAKKGANTIVTISDDGSSSCGLVAEVAERYGMDVVATIPLPPEPTLQHFIQVALNVSQVNPDVVITCIFVDCPQWIKAMRAVEWTPKAQIFNICGSNVLEDVDAGLRKSDLTYMMSMASWSSILSTPPDSVTGWNPARFAEVFEDTLFTSPVYQHVAAAASISVIIQAIEQARSLDSDAVREVLATQTFQTMYGQVSFDQNGQSLATSLVLQYSEEGELNVVYPPEVSAEGLEILYPMPTWGNRDCNALSSCIATNGTCLQDGHCLCSNGETSLISLGVGETARCRPHPEENFRFVSDTLIGIGLFLALFQSFLSAICAAWTWRNRKLAIVKASQPFFLVLIALGCLILAVSILPLSAQGKYRHQRNPTTWEFTEEEESDVHLLDAACMAFPWFAGLGFSLIFSALFAKIWRVQKLVQNAQEFRRREVHEKDVLYIVIGFLILQSLLLVSWELGGPLRWDRDIKLIDSDGLAIESVGKCQSETSLGFYLGWGVLNGFCLIYALWLCYLTRNVSDDFAEGKWITINITFIFQVLILAVPLLIIAEDDQSASYFLHAMVVFTVSLLSTLFIFGPKMWRVYRNQGNTVVAASFRSPTTTATHLQGLHLRSSFDTFQSDHQSTFGLHPTHTGTLEVLTEGDGNESSNGEVPHSSDDNGKTPIYPKTSAILSEVGRNTCAAISTSEAQPTVAVDMNGHPFLSSKPEIALDSST